MAPHVISSEANEVSAVEKSRSCIPLAVTEEISPLRRYAPTVEMTMGGHAPTVEMTLSDRRSRAPPLTALRRVPKVTFACRSGEFS